VRGLYRVPGTSLLVGDNQKILHELGDRGVKADLIGGSPPYNLDMGYEGMDDKQRYEAYLESALEVCEAMGRVSHPGTRLWLNVPLDTNAGGKQPVMFDWHWCAVNAGWRYQTTILWLEGNISRRTAWGSWRSPRAPFVNTAAEAILIYYRKDFKRTDKPYEQTIDRDEFLDWTLGLWKFSGANPKRHGHPAPFPEELPRRVVSMYSFPGDLVIDPWNGSGSSTVVAHRLGRFGVGIEQSPVYAYRSYLRHLGVPGWHLADLPADQLAVSA
jgi:site-specific DNA-methyltransferase (adenine-specific)